MIMRSLVHRPLQRSLLAFALFSAFGTGFGCAQTKSDAKPTSTAQTASAPEPTSAPERRPPPVEPVSSIGSAKMKDDGTLVLQLRASDSTGIRGDAQIVYPPSHPQYQAVLKHLGGMKPGEEKPVPPWPDH